MARLLVVDDEKNIRDGLQHLFESQKHQTFAAERGREALAVLARQGEMDLVLSDWRMAEMNGLELLKEIKSRYPATIVILMTAYGTIQNAVDAMKAGAYDYVTKPFSLEEIELAVDRALEVKQLRAENRALKNSINGVPLLESGSPQFRAMIETAYAAASSEATILLTGESGTGKNVLARQIHEWSPRRDRPFVTVNCTTLSEHLLESELFGHVKGSFTGAIKDKPGRLEAAEGGTVLLDEIGDLTPNVQSKLLRFLHERTFERVGGSQTIKVDARIIAATNQHLEQLVKEKRFREDLYYRLNVIELHVPALRDRPGEILKLAEHFAAQAARTHHKPAHSIAAEAREALVAYSWPGNIRELRNVMERAVILSRGETINLSDLPDKILASPDKLAHGNTLEEMERRHIEVVLEQAVTLEEAAEMLGINVATLWRKRRRYGLD